VGGGEASGRDLRRPAGVVGARVGRGGGGGFGGQQAPAAISDLEAGGTVVVGVAADGEVAGVVEAVVVRAAVMV